jgi:sporulation protein YlmC with PRC-barrel domain
MCRIALLPPIAFFGLLLGPCAALLQAEEARDLADWDYEELRTGWSVERLRNTAEIIDQNGESIGTVKDLIIAPDGKIKRLVIEAAGGLFNLGAAQFAYPFDQATFDGPDRVVVALEEEHLEDYSLFAEEDAPAQRRNWRVSELIRDYVYLEDGYRFGWIDDAIIGADGTIKAVVVQPDVRVTRAPRPVALPFLPEEGRFDPSMYFYQVPFSADAVAELDVFFYDQMETHTGWDEEQ